MNRRAWIVRLAGLAVAFGSAVVAHPVRHARGALLRGAPGGQEPWDDRLELAVAFQFGDERAGAGLRRPYLAAYIEEPGGRLVRTVALWAQENESWVRSLTRWYRADRERRGGTDLPSSLTGATRPPGYYTIVWDGRDEDGAPVPQGEYALVLETVRQGGRAFFMRSVLSIGSEPFRIDLDPLGSFTQVSVELRERN